MIKVLVASADYPRPSGERPMMFVHVRNKEYIKNDIDVTVLNFAAISNYDIDGIRVITEQSYYQESAKYDLIISHAANVRNHYRFLKKEGNKFKKLIFIFHGHEILRINEVYPKPYSYVGTDGPRRLFQNGYDSFKFRVWSKFYKKHINDEELIFVSNWIYKEFKKNLKFTEKELKDKVHIINNSVGKTFEEHSYNKNCEKKYDFITIRSNLDDSKYGVDLVLELARMNPSKRFLLIGKGRFFDFNEKPQNIRWVNRTLSHEEMLRYLDESRCALLLTREDTQGVMTCECATYGIPVITSDLEVCREVFSGFENVKMISNDVKKVNLDKIYRDIPIFNKKNKKYFMENTVRKEIELIEQLL